MARRSGWPASLTVASLAFAAAVVGLRALPLDSGFPLPLLALYAGGVAAAIAGLRPIPPPARLEQPPAAPPSALPLRTFAARGPVRVTTRAAPHVGRPARVLRP